LAASRLWAGSGAIGKHLSNDTEVVGVVGTVREGIIGGNPNPLPPHVYTPFGQRYNVDTQIHLRVAAQGREAEARLLETIRREIQRVDDRLPVLTLKTLANHVDSSFDVWVTKTGARIVGIFAAIAVALAVVGLYGVRTYTVARRTREIGIRMAVGAESAEVLTMVLREGLAVVAIGVAVGMVLAVALGRVLAAVLYEVPTVDAAVLSLAALLLTGVSATASYLPARRAAQVDPMVALRDE
jgi:putative ABC transport system permease protein